MAAFATSYIKTEAAQVTRNADAASMTGTNFSSWFNAAEGSLFVAGSRVSSTWGLVARFQVSTASSDQDSMSTASYVAGVTVQSFSGGSFSTDASAQPRAVAYDGTTAIACSAGNLSNQITKNLPTPLFDAFYIGRRANQSAFATCLIKKISYYPQRLTDANLQALTA